MKKLFVLGVDGATFDILKPWIAAGHLPGFGQLMSDGCHALLKSTIPPLSPVSWTSIATGVNPGKHGVYDFLMKKEIGGNQRPLFSFARGSDRKAKAFWEIFTEHEKSSIIVNMPCSYPPDPINGQMISGWDSAPDRSLAFHPKNLYDEIKEKFGEYYMGPFDLLDKSEMVHTNPESNRKLHEAMLAITKMRRKVLLYLVREYPWDMFFGVFTETDVVSHRFWHTLDPENFQSSPIFQVYREIDGFILELLKTFGNDIDIMVISDHGFTSLYSGIDLNFLLEQNGFLKRRVSTTGFLLFFLLRRMKTLRRRLKSVLRKNWMPAKFATMKPRHMNIDFKNSRIFFEGSYPFFYASPGSNNQELFPELKQSLAALKYEGKFVFKDILRNEDAFWGPYSDQIADYVGILNDHFEVAGADAFMGEGMRNKQVFCDHVWDGNHSENGVFIFKGEGVPAKQLDRLNVFDIAPTVLAYYGIPIPKELDGKPIEDVLGSREICYSDYNIYKDDSVKGKELTKDESEALEDRLKSLGYL